MRLNLCLLGLLGLVLSSCGMPTDGGAPGDDGREGAVAPFALEPVRPGMRPFRAATTEYTGARAVPALPPVKAVGYAGGALPVEVQAFGRDGLPIAPASTGMKAYDPSDLKPVRQLIWGGVYGPHDAGTAYRLEVGDELTLHVQDHDELSGTLTVLVDGTVELPLVKERVPARGRTVTQLQNSIVVTLRTYARDPHIVTLALNVAGGRYYHIFGAVRFPGRYPMGLETVRVSEAVFRANSESVLGRSMAADVKARLAAESSVGMRTGFAVPDKADLGRVFLITPHRTRPTKRVVNAGAALLGGRTGRDPVIQPGTIVFVPGRGGEDPFGRFAADELEFLPTGP